VEIVSSNKADVRDFLVTRRARITPQQAGLTFYGGNRRVPGLRREEVAMLAGVSADYYTRLEKGNLTGVSDSVLEAIAAALQLNEAERLHLFDLARTANTSPARAARRRAPQQVRPGIQLILDGMTDTPAFIRNSRLDVLAVNALGRALYSPVFADPGQPVNLARFRFLDPAARDFYPDFADSAHTTVALLRTEAGRDPFNPSFTGLIGELSTRSKEFRALWAAHDVRLHRTGVKHFRHPVVGLLDLMFEAMALEADEGLTLTAYTAEPGTSSHDGLRLLASGAATHQREDDTHRAGSAATPRAPRPEDPIPGTPTPTPSAPSPSATATGT
jgi:transcriptional regulator with XRE-family HTH domain